MTDLEAIQKIRELGATFVVAVAEQTGKDADSGSDLMNGIAAYTTLSLKGLDADLDESIDRVMRIVYELVKEKLDGYTQK
jgi:hypothetical protein